MQDAGYRNLCFVDSLKSQGSKVAGLEVAYTNVNQLSANEFLLITIGNNERRKQIMGESSKLRQDIATFTSPYAISHVDMPIGRGTQILSGAIINSGARIGDAVIVNSGAIVEHDCIVSDYCHISPNATIAGEAELKEGVWVGAGATVLPGVKIAAWTVVGAGTVVLKNISIPGTYAGVPAQRVK
jgi:acetyltransferase EpsM